MKNLIALSILIFFTAQLFSQKTLRIRAGIGAANAVHFFDIYRTHANPILSTSLGLSTEIKLNHKYEIQPELNFIRKGFGYIVDDFFEEGTIYPNMSINYLTLNTNLRMNINNTKKKSRRYAKKNLFYFLFGAQTGIHVSSKWKFNEVITVDGKELIKPFDLGVNLGIGYERKLYRSKNHYGFDLRYTHGVLNIKKTPHYSTNLRLVEMGFYYGFGFLKQKRKRRSRES